MSTRHEIDPFKKRALDALLEMFNDPEYATHQHHSDPNFTTQTGKDYAGAGSTEVEPGVSVTIPPQDLHMSAIVQTDPKLAPPENVEEAEFFKESDPAMRPVEEEAAAHEFFKESDEYEMVRASSGQTAVIARKNASLVQIKIAGHRVEDTGTYDEKKESEFRIIAHDTAQYAEEGPSFDPTGKYLCGTCFYMLGTNECAFVEGDDISPENGTCRYWKKADGTNPVPLERKYDKEEAGYTERPHGEGFGCARCDYGAAAKAPDSKGRESWCSRFGMHVEPLACCAKNEGDNDIVFNKDGKRKRAAAKELYHVTHTSKVPGIRQKGIIPLQESNWVKRETRERYGEGEIFAFNNLEDAVRWGAKMDWEFNQGMGTGKISIVVFKPGKEKWTVDDADPMSQASAKGQWLKAHGAIKPDQIVKIVPVTSDMTRAVVQGKGVKLGAAREQYERLMERWMLFYKRFFGPRAENFVSEKHVKDSLGNAKKFVQEIQAFVEELPKERGLFNHAFLDLEEVTPHIRQAAESLAVVEACIKNDSCNTGAMVNEFTNVMNRLFTAYNNLGAEYYYMQKDRTAAVTKSYGMGTPIGGTENQPEEEDEEEKKASAELEAEDARLAAEIEDEDNLSFAKSASLAMRVDFSPFQTASQKVIATDNAGWFEKSARPTEQKLELLQKQFGLTPEQLELCIAADPSPNQTDYVAWIAKWVSKNQIRLPEDTEKIKGQLATFMKLKRSPAFTSNKDIQQYDPAKLFETLSSGSAAPALSKKEQDREIIAKGSKIVVNDGDLVIYKVTDPKALSLLSGGTNWCTAQEHMGEGYLKDGPSYVIFEGGSAFAQFHPASNQLMNRQDVCMLERVYEERDPYSRGWGRGKKRPKLMVSFITDQTLLRALQLLAAVEPGVEEWVRENTSDPAELEKILGEKAQEEQEENASSYGTYYGPRSKKFSMTVRHALVTGKQLTSEQEAQLSSGVDIDLLFKYGTKFHAGQPWEPLAKAILAQKGISKEMIDYSTKFLKGRWPEGEAKMLKNAFLKTRGSYNMKLAIEYAQRVVKGRWPELEAKFHRAKPSAASGYGSAEYAINVLKQRWAGLVQPRKDGKINEEEIIILGAPEEAQEYAETLMPGQRWPEFERTALAANYLSALTDYAMTVVKGRVPDVEEAILNGNIDPTQEKNLALDYAEKVIKARWPEYEQKIVSFVKNDVLNDKNHYGKEYTPNTWGGTVMERYNSYHSGSRLPNVIENYIEVMIKSRWPELEQALLARYQEHPGDWTLNQTFMDGYLRALRTMCEEKYKDQLKAVNNVDARTNQLHGELDSFEKAHDQAKKEVAEAEKEILSKDAQCTWPEGEQRLRSRDENYERILLQEFKDRNDRWHAEGEAKEWVNYKGYWITYFGNDEIERYVHYIDGIGKNWPFGDELMDEFADVDEERWGSSSWHQPRKRRTRPTPEKKPQPVQSSLLKKALVPIHEAPKLKPPREQYRTHIDPEAERSAMEGVMDGVMDDTSVAQEPAPRQQSLLKKGPQKEQIDPTINPEGEDNWDASLIQPVVAAAESPTPLACPECGGHRFYNLAQETDNYDRYRCLDCKHEWEPVPREAEIMPKRMGNWKLYAWPAGTVQFGEYGEIKRPAPKGQVWYVGDKAKALPILKDNWDLTHNQENQLLERGALNLPDTVLRLTNADYYAKPTMLRPRPPEQKLLTGSLFQKEAKPLSRAVLPLALSLLAPGAGAHTPKPKAPAAQHDPRNVSKMEIEPAPGYDYSKGAPKERPKLDPDYLLKHENRFDPNVYTPEQLIEKGVLRGKLETTKMTSLLKKADRKSEKEDAERKELLRLMEDASDEAYEAFLKENYLQQIAQDDHITMQELWDKIGKEYANEYFVSKRNREPEDWHAHR